MRPSVRTLPTTWAERNRIMPPDAPEPGAYRASRTPYMIPLTEAAVSFAYRGIVAVCGTQMGKTSSLMNIQGEKLDNDPAPCLWIGPTKSNVENVIVPQFEAMISGCESLRSKLTDGRQKALLKRIAGTVMRFAWSGSATEIASMPAHTVVVDEVDKCEPVPGHGSVIVQAEARISNYRHSGGIIVATSSPTEGTVETEIHPETGLEHWKLSDPKDVASEIWRQWMQSTRHEFMLLCPECGEYFAPRLRYLTGWEEGASPVQAKRRARLLHAKCGSLLSDRHKQWMVENGRAIAPGQRVVGGEVVGDPPESEWWGIWISGLCSPWVSWGDRAYDWIRAARSHDEESIRATINLGFGELFRISGEAPPWEEIRKLSDDSLYDLGTVPVGVRLIFLTVDVQKDRLVCCVRGWGVGMESWLIHREELWGDTSSNEVFQRLDELAGREWDGHGIQAVAVDSGFRTEMVYSWCVRRGARAYATKGRDKPSKLYASADVETQRNGRKVKRGLKVWTFDHGYFKGWVHDHLRWPQDQPGAWHLPRQIGDDYCRQLVAEQRMRLPSGAISWVRTGTNDWLDAEALQVLVAHLEGVRYLKPPDAPAPAARVRKTRSPGVQL